MFDLLKKGVLTGVGIGMMTKEKISEFAKKLAEEAKLSEEEGSKFVEDILIESEKRKKYLEDSINKQVQNVLERLNVPTRDELDKIKKRIDVLQNSFNKET